MFLQSVIFNNQNVNFYIDQRTEQFFFVIFDFYEDNHNFFDDLMNFFILKFKFHSIFFRSIVFSLCLREKNLWKICISFLLSIINWFSLLIMLYLNNRYLPKTNWLTKKLNILTIFQKNFWFTFLAAIFVKKNFFLNSKIRICFPRRWKFYWNLPAVLNNKNFDFCVLIRDMLNNFFLSFFFNLGA